MNYKLRTLEEGGRWAAGGGHSKNNDMEGCLFRCLSLSDHNLKNYSKEYPALLFLSYLLHAVQASLLVRIQDIPSPLQY